RWQRPFLQALGWMDVIALVIGPDQCGTAKPSARIFSPIPHPILAHIGDQRYQDVLAAQRAGIASIWVKPAGEAVCVRIDPLSPAAVQPDYTIARPDQAVPILSELMQSKRHLLYM
ncbi:MAG: hypothetical protein OWS74_00895, partial [Firmicutes bacterium]|nr:hypothetical protein [Bacillota bacterium]